VSFNPQQVSAATESGVTSFIPEDGDPRFQALSQFVIDQAIADWHDWFAQELRVDISINLPVSFLRDPACLEYLYRRLPDQAALDGIIVEINGTAVTRSLPLVQDLAKQMRFRKVGISIDDLGMEWPDFAGLDDFPFVEIKVDRAFVGGCAQDRRKRAYAAQIIDLANHYGARTVADGWRQELTLSSRAIWASTSFGFSFRKAHGRAAIHAHDDGAAAGNASGAIGRRLWRAPSKLGGGRSCGVTTFICQPPIRIFRIRSATIYAMLAKGMRERCCFRTAS